MAAGKTKAAARTEKRHVRGRKFDLPEGSVRRAVDTEDAASREELAGETVRGEAPTEMGVSAVAEAYSHQNYDATSRNELDAQRALAARFEELEEFKRRDVYAKVTVAEEFENTGKQAIPARWVDVNKGDDRNPEKRSRLVVRENERSKADDACAAIPPLEAKKVLPPPAVRARAKSGDVKELSRVDAKKAYERAPARWGRYVQLNASLYGARGARRNSGEMCVEAPQGLGFVVGKSSPRPFWDEVRDLRSAIRSDDITTVGIDVSLNWFERASGAKPEVNVRTRLGSHNTDAKSVRILIRITEWRPGGIRYEADQRRVEEVEHAFGLAGGDAAVAPAVREKECVSEDSEKLGAWAARWFRELVAKSNFVGQDRPAAQNATRKVRREMSAPRGASPRKLKRLARYPRGAPRMRQWYKRQTGQGALTAVADAYDAGRDEAGGSAYGGKR